MRLTLIIFLSCSFLHFYEPLVRSFGKYRFSAFLRVKTIRDEREYKDPNFETLPPMDEIKYMGSKWFYFTVPNDIR